MRKHGSTILLIIIFFIGLSLMLYPSVSDYWNSFHQSQAIISYDSALSALTPRDHTALYEAADRYNKDIAALEYPMMDYQQVEGYESLLDVTGSGIMSYITIPSIKVELPIYHGTDEAVLQVAVGHIQGTSLPVGGAGTHTVLSAHRGLPSARLFTDLDKLKLGDTFVLNTLDRTLTYQVDQILIVEPTDVEALYAQEGEDYCTLVTCTPYGVNSHRMLVRGTRVENEKGVRTIRVTADAVQLEPLVVAPVVASPILLLGLIYLLLPNRKKR